MILFYDEFMLPPPTVIIGARYIAQDTLSPSSCRYHLCSSHEIESYLPEEDINGIGDQPREPGPRGVVVKMGETKVLLDECVTRLHKR